MAQRTRSTFDDVEDLAAQAQVLPDPAAKSPFGEVKLPPPELVDELDNSDVKQPAAEEPVGEAVTLDFFGDDLPVRSFPLKHPFTWRESGVRVEEVEVHQLSTHEVGQAIQEQSDKPLELYDLYARMTRVKGTDVRLTPAVLRKMPQIDGGPIVEAAYDFLPRFFRPGAV